MRELRVPFVFAKVRPKAIPTHVRDAIFQNCVFQMSAIFEDYLYQVVTSWMNRVRSAGLPASGLSKEIRLSHILMEFEKVYREYWFDGDEGKARRAIGSKSSALLSIDDSYSSPFISPEKIFTKSKFPTQRNIKRLFGRLGIVNIGADISRRTQSDFWLNLRSFMDIRNALAHENPPDVTDLDVSRYMTWVLSWLSAFDREMYSLICRTSGSQYWQ